MCPRTQLIGDNHPVRSSPCRSCGDPLRANPPSLHGTSALWAEITVITATGSNTVSSIYRYIALEPCHRSRSCVCLGATVDWRAVCQEPVTVPLSYFPSRLSVYKHSEFPSLISDHGEELKKSKLKSTTHPSFLHLGMASPLRLLTGGGPRPHTWSIHLQIAGAIARIGRFPVISHLRRPHTRWNGGKSFVMFCAVPWWSLLAMRTAHSLAIIELLLWVSREPYANEVLEQTLTFLTRPPVRSSRKLERRTRYVVRT